MLNRLLLLFSCFLTPSLAVAQDTVPGKFTILEETQRAPFGGVLFDPDATSYLLTLPKYYEDQCQLRLDFELGKTQADMQLEIDNLNIRLGTLADQHQTMITQKDSEILALQNTVKKNSKMNPWIWGTVGAIIGASFTVGVVKATSD